MSSPRHWSDGSASDSDQNDDEYLDAAFHEFEEHDARDVVDSSAATSSPSSARARRRSGSRRLPSMRLLEEVDAETDTENVSPSLRELLDQLHSDDRPVLPGLVPFSHLLPHAGTTSRFHQLLDEMGTHQVVHVQTAALTELGETLSLASDETLAVSGFSVEKFVPAVVALMRVPPSSELLLLAARALSIILELFPTTAIPKAGTEDVIPLLCAKLLALEYMDVAELAVQLLDTMLCTSDDSWPSSSVVPHGTQWCAHARTQVIAANGLVALLQFLDFFPLDTQRRAAHIVSHLCTDFPSQCLAHLEPAVPLLTHLLRSSDPELLQSTVSGLARLANSPAFRTSPAFATTIATEEVCALLVATLAQCVEKLDRPAARVALLGIVRFLTASLGSFATYKDVAWPLHHVHLPPVVMALMGKTALVWDTQVVVATFKLVLVLLPDVDEEPPLGLVPLEFRTLAYDQWPFLVHVYDATARADVRLDCFRVMYRSYLVGQATTPSTAAFERPFAAFLARVLQPHGQASRLERLGESTRATVAMALRMIDRSLVPVATRQRVLTTYERHGVATLVRCYAAWENARGGQELETIHGLSTRLVHAYFGSASWQESRMVGLKHLVAELNEALQADRGEARAQLVRVLRQLCALGAQRDAILTTHELTKSGLVQALHAVLSESIGRQALSQVLDDECASHGHIFLSCLVECLHGAIALAMDGFATSLHEATHGLSAGRLATDVELLTQHIKVHVLIEHEVPLREPDQEDHTTLAEDAHETATMEWRKTLSKHETRFKVQDCSVHDTVVLVEPLARIETIEDFIAEKVWDDRAWRLGDATLDATSRHDLDACRDAKTARDPGRRVVAVYNDHVLSPDTSLVEALVKWGDVRSVPVHARIWRALPHDVTFRVVEASETMRGDAQNDESVDHRERGASDAWWDDVWAFLSLLTLVRQCRPHDVGSPLVFTNVSLSLHVRRVLHDPLAVVTNSLPHWAYRLVHAFAFVLDLPTRYHFLYVTTSGCARALSYLCRTVWKKAVQDEPAVDGLGRSSTRRRRGRERSSRNRASGLDALAQMVTVPRLKVRVARSRLLASALKLMTMYGGTKNVLELEFLGEVGTGLGPTTEFYTLVCHHIQAKALGLWRDDDRLETQDEEEKKWTREKEGPTTRTWHARPVPGYHRIAVFHCVKCAVVRVPTCALHGQLLSVEKTLDTHPTGTRDRGRKGLAAVDAPRGASAHCAQCVDQDAWHWPRALSCACGESTPPRLTWWIVSKDEVAYLASVFPRQPPRVTHPVLQCPYCETVTFPGTEAGLVEMDGHRMVSCTGRRMDERDYRGVTHHVSAVCHGTPLTVWRANFTLDEVHALVAHLASTPEVLESEVHTCPEVTEGDDATRLVSAPFGLFPKPFLPDEEGDEMKWQQGMELKERTQCETRRGKGDDKKVWTWFYFLGQFVGQAFLDERLINLPFARPFLRALRGERLVGDGISIATSLSFVAELDPALATSLRYLHALALKYHATKGVQSGATAVDVTAWSQEVAALCRVFTMIGADDIPLVPGGHDVAVTLSSLHDYVALNLEFLLHRTIASQVRAFRHGFHASCGREIQLGHELFQVFDVVELELLSSDRTNGQRTLWDRHGVALRQHMVCAHGYSSASRAIHDLVAILCDLAIEDQRLFVRFVTGADRLPVGGLGHLEPKLTVVRKGQGPGGAEERDAVLPSASTCTNYLKLPEYSTREVMKARLLYCITEGQGSFHLS